MIWCRAHPVPLRACRADATALQRQVRSGAASFNNQQEVAGNRVLTAAKMVYYYCFATLYGAAGGCAHVRPLVTDQASFLQPGHYCVVTAAIVAYTDCACRCSSLFSAPDGFKGLLSSAIEYLEGDDVTQLAVWYDSHLSEIAGHNSINFDGQALFILARPCSVDYGLISVHLYISCLPGALLKSRQNRSDFAQLP